MSHSCSLGVGLAVLLASLTAVHGEEAEKPRTDLYGDPLPPGAVARLGTVRLRQAEADLAFSKDGKQLMSFGRDGEIRVWSVATGQLLKRKRLLGDYCREVALSPDGTKAAAWRGTEVILYDATTGKELGKQAAGYPGNSGNYPQKLLAFSPDSKMLAVERRLWDFTADKISESRKRELLTRSWLVATGPDGKRMAEITRSMPESEVLVGQVHVWDPVTKREIGKKWKWQGTSLAFSTDGKMLALGGIFEIVLLDTDSLKPKARLPKGRGVHRLTFSPEGRFLAGAAYYEDGALLLWNVAEAKEPRRLGSGGRDARFAFTSDCKLLACQSNSLGSAIRLWDTASGRQLLHRPGHDRLVEALAISPNGKHVASVGADGMYLWDAASGRSLHAWEEWDCHDHACLFSSDGKRLICASANGQLQVRDVASGKELQSYELGPGFFSVHFHALALSADGKRLTAIVGLSEDSAKLHVWDLAAGKQVREVSYPLEERIVSLSRGRREPRGFAHAAFSPDAEVVSVWREGRVALEEVATGRLLVRLPQGMGEPDRFWRMHRSRAIVFSPDGRLVTAAILKARENRESWFDGNGLSLLETATGAEILRLDLADFDQVAFTPDSRGLVVTNGRRLRVWDTDSGERLVELALPQLRRKEDAWDEAQHHCLSMLPNGRVALATEAGDILIWDLAPATWPIRKPQRGLDAEELETLWSQLAEDARKAHRAAATLTASPSQTLPFLQQRFHPAKEDEHVKKLLADLDSDAFETREAATRGLTRLLYRAEPKLRQALAGKPSLEMRRRLEAILARPRLPSAEDLRLLRAIAVLEHIGTPEARRLLEKLARGAEAPETQAAQAALQRLRQREDSAKEKSSP